MPAKDPSIEKLDLRFRAESVPQKNVFPGGWILWVLTAICLGLGLTFASKHFLSEGYSRQLATTATLGEAFLAIESLQALDPIASLGIVRGLENLDPQIEKMTYRALDANISKWQQVDSLEANQYLHRLAERLFQLPPSTPSSGLIHASSLAARMYSTCADANDRKFDAIMKLCEQIVQRGGATPLESDSISMEEAFVALNRPERVPSPPPPLPTELPGGASKTAEEQYTFSLSDTAEEPYSPQVVPGPLSGQRASIQLVPFGSRRTESANLESPIPQSTFALEQSALIPSAPSIVVSGGDAPLMRMTLSKPESIEGFQDLPDEQLVKKLGSPQPQVSQAATLALRSHHWPDEHIALASELATCSAARRLQLVHAIAARHDLNSSPWLLWMAESGEPEVRKASVSLLSSMVEPDVERGLRLLLAREQDESVRLAIQKTLMVSAEQELRR